jgi:UDP-3-O-[3-hydroxymyristoyl] glucosamine N-acyltransferase
LAVKKTIMPDVNFYSKPQAKSLGTLASLSGAELSNASHADFIIEDVASLSDATSTQISFLDNKKYKDQFSTTKAGACIIHPSMQDHAPSNIKLLLSDNPYKSFALISQAFYAQNLEPFISPLADIHPSAIIHPTAHIESFVKIGAGVSIGAQSIIRSHASISHALIGDHVHIYSGVRIGQDGFGFAIDPKGYVKVPQLGRVIIEGHSEIGANTTIDRGSMGDTIIGRGTWCDNLIQIAHNVKIGKGCIIAAQVGIAGSSIVGDYTMIGGQAGIAGHLTIGSMVKIAAQSGVTRDIPDREEWMGYPAMPMKQFLRHTAYLNKITKRG